MTDRVGRRWASSMESRGAGRYNSFRKEFNGFGPRSTLLLGSALKPNSPSDSKLEGWEKRDRPRPTKRGVACRHSSRNVHNFYLNVCGCNCMST